MRRKLTARQIKSLLARIEKHKAEIGKHRDALRDIESDLSQIGDDCDEAVLALEGATDALSRLL